MNVSFSESPQHGGFTLILRDIHSVRGRTPSIQAMFSPSGLPSNIYRMEKNELFEPVVRQIPSISLLESGFEADRKFIVEIINHIFKGTFPRLRLSFTDFVEIE